MTPILTTIAAALVALTGWAAYRLGARRARREASRAALPPRPPVTYDTLVDALDRGAPAAKFRLFELVVIAQPMIERQGADGQKRTIDLLEAWSRLPPERQWLLLELALLLGDRAR